MEFNEAQQKIINNIFGAYLISAPVGTGKTTILAERVVKALDLGVQPEEILCLTFTNRAAEEMSERIKKRIKSKEILDNLTIKTFHGFCAYFIKLEAKQICIDFDFAIFDENEQLEIMKNILVDYPDLIVEGKSEKYQIFSLIDKLYDYRLNKLEQEIGCVVRSKHISGDLIEINKKYLQALRDQNALDFNELVLLTAKSLYFDKKLRRKWSKKYKFIQLDEFQDTHLVEYLVLKELAKGHKNISLIGDLDQTIYKWRGSNPRLISKFFKKHFAPVKELSLTINYRFDSNILEAIKSFLKNFAYSDTNELKSLKDKKVKKCVDIFGGYNFNEEISWVIDNIKKIRRENPKAEIAVLTRSNFAVNRAANIFFANKIEHITVDKYDFFRRQEIKDIYAYLKIIFNKFDLESALRIVLRPSRNIGVETLKSIKKDGDSIGLKISDFLSFKNYNFSEPFYNLIEKWNKGRIIVLDTETTGLNVLKDEIIQIYAIEIIKGKRGKDFYHILKNNIPVGDSARVHGMTDEFLQKKGREPKEVFNELKEFIGIDIVVGHNINFDISMIKENGKRNDINFEFEEYYDTLDIAKRFIRNVENYKLTTLSKILKLEVATHDAKDDVLATVGLLGVLVDRLKIGTFQRAEIFKKFSKKFIQLSNLIYSWQKIIRDKRPAEVLEYIWESSGLKNYYSKDKESEKRFKSIENLVSIFKEKDNLDKPADFVLRELINFASLSKNIDFLALEKGKIPIVTIHQVKGLEFDCVFIIGVNEFKFPVYNADLEEEKKLFYVAMTRAKKRIFISYSNFNDYNRPINKSIFINLIDQKYINFFE
ncbi:MAG: UvrD-helicase domain-containing protein [Xanthomonadaceae bacterium]|nr:UvrD-helicase domain-containing protein [Rhodospirillaceae bacterium]NIA18171.1 UvrD-helicase domain-containing protein [Xanthomonadaceae bacterium]